MFSFTFRFKYKYDILQMYRYRICGNQDIGFFLKGMKKIKGNTIQELYKNLRNEYEIGRIQKRRKFIVGLPPGVVGKKIDLSKD
tara:strand:+ start:1086 stop:1337 length:252 start_codon:yes stop_codon:yes gene_type:complete